MTRALALLVVLAFMAGCTSLGKSGQTDLAVLQDLAPFEVNLRLKNPADQPILVQPGAFHLVGADGAVFQGIPSAREGAIGSTSLGPDRVLEGWVAFQVEAYAERPLTLVFEADGVRLETTLPNVE